MVGSESVHCLFFRVPETRPSTPSEPAHTRSGTPPPQLAWLGHCSVSRRPQRECGAALLSSRTGPAGCGDRSRRSLNNHSWLSLPSCGVGGTVTTVSHQKLSSHHQSITSHHTLIPSHPKSSHINPKSSQVIQN